MKLSVVLIVLYVALFGGCADADGKRSPYRYLIPDGYVGWVEMKFGIADAPELPVHEGFRIAKFPPAGVLKTSSKLQNGWAKDEYYYYKADAKEKLSEGYQTGLINGGATGLRGGDSHQSLWFFVGTYDQYMKHGYVSTTAPRIGPIQQ